ncbi:hypothetical protein [uncultured Marixanthomonas sp.]|uniref:hypothetical protein n=1 Tax=uncultured Marixanthomonas sp. TaxID=757245 RepID=UPI0030DB9BC0|tara:strand:- start:29160 stop:31493 length:2334 start_codon:yes stop_codon:yes gene_type:complete
MSLKYIVEICVGIDVAIFGIAYPIIITEINKIGDKYDSNYLSELFRLEWISKEIRFWSIRVSFFQLILLSTITSFLFLILNRKPLFGWDNIIINNSAELIILALTLILIFCFIFWMQTVSLYNGKSVRLLKHLISRYEKIDHPEAETKKYFLRGINDFAYYTIKSQDNHLQQLLLDFYWSEFEKCRVNHKEQLDSLIENKKKKKEYKKLLTQGVEYPIELYELIYRINLETKNTTNYLTTSLEFNATSGWWLYGKDYHQLKISELTYRWVWKILILNLDNDRNLKMYWSKANQYYTYAFRVYPEYADGETEPINKEEIEIKQKERLRFLEFHYTLGGLLLQKNKYSVMNYLFNYSSSSPPNYVLLPQSISDIFYWFERFSNSSNLRMEDIEVYFKFPDLDNYGVSHKIKFWICSYICVLYIRQFTLVRFMTFHNHTGMPNLPDEKRELKGILNGIPVFRSYLDKILENDKLLSEVGLDSINKEKKEIIKKHLSEVEEAAIKKLDYTQEVKELSESKISQFNKRSKFIIKKAFNEYKNILLDYDKKLDYEDTLKLVVNGGVDIMPKSSFVDNDIPHLNFDDALAQSIVRNSVKKNIPTSFSVAKTEKYLVSSDNILGALEKTISGKTKKKNIIILGFNVDYQIKEKIKNAEIDILLRHSTNNHFRNIFFILNRDDLPRLQKRDISKKEKTKLALKPISKSLKLYSSIIELNKNEELKSEWLNAGYSKEELDKEPLVQTTISFNWLLLWKKNRRIIQLGISNPSKEQGMESDINDIKPL